MLCKWRVSFEGKGIKYLGVEEMRIFLDLVPLKKIGNFFSFYLKPSQKWHFFRILPVLLGFLS